MGVTPRAEAAGPGQYSPPDWWPLRDTHVVGCTNGNGCVVPAEGYHGYWALDINATRETEIYAAGAGQVVSAIGDQGGNCEFLSHRSGTCPDGSRGNLVAINHDAAGEVNTFYLHFTDVFVQTGDWVDQNTLLGTAGDSGLSYPDYVHLHFELRHPRIGVDPAPLRACHGDQVKSFPGEFGKTSWSQVTAYEYAVRSDGAGCAGAIEPTDPTGRLESATRTDGGTVRFVGRARDADTAGPVTVVGLIDGNEVGRSRPTPVSLTQGFDFAVPVDGRAHTACVRALNLGGGSDVILPVCHALDAVATAEPPVTTTTTTISPATPATIPLATPTVVVAGTPLARTGSSAGRLAVVGVLTAGLGALVVVGTRRRRGWGH
ncbi:MAG: M23 family metallopeptidase [Acidimicrobiales bacterium]